MTLYVYRSRNSKHLNRPIKTRLQISVRFVPTVMDTCAEPETEIVSGVFSHSGDGQGQSDVETTQQSDDPGDLSLLLKSNWERRLIAAAESATDQVAEADPREETWVASQALSVTQLNGVPAGTRVGRRAAMAMRLRLVGPDTSTKKEYHHAKSLLA